MKQLLSIKILFVCLCFGPSLSSAVAQECRYVSEGAFEQAWKKVRIVNRVGDVLDGADNFSDALLMGQRLIDRQICTPKNQDCRLASEGIVGGIWVKHRIQMDDEMVFGADDMAAALRQISALRKLGFCQ